METQAEEQRPGVLIENERSGVEDNSNQRLLYTIPGVLHFLQTECAKIEAERAQFELERTELQARIAFLEGERRAQDNLKKDLVRRIRMLEHALSKEREKSIKQPAGNDENCSTKTAASENKDTSEELAKLGISTQPVEDLEDLLANLGQTKSQKARSQMISEGRQLLRKYLQEIGYADTIVDVRSARVRALLGLEQANSNTTGIRQANSMLPNGPASTSPFSSGNQSGLSPGRVPLNSGSENIAEMSSNRSGERSDNSLIPELRKALEEKNDGTVNDLSEEDNAALNELNSLLQNTSGNPRDTSALTVGITNPEFRATSEAGEANVTVLNQSGGDLSPRSKISPQHPLSSPSRPEVRFLLRSHYDAIRCIAFHPSEAALVSASDDTTVKIWNLEKQNQGALSSAPSPQIRRGSQPVSACVVNDLEPLQTFRSHCSPVLCAALGSGGDRLYSGGLDGTLACYSLHSLLTSSSDIYDPWDSSRFLAFIAKAHDDALWQIVAHPTRPQLLATCGADGAVRLWNVGNPNSADSDSEKIPSDSPDQCSPVILRVMSTNEKFAASSVDFSRVEYTQLIASYSTNSNSSSVIVYDFETGSEVARVDNICLNSKVNQVVSHPTLPLVALACDDGHIRLLDLAAASAVFPASPVPSAVIVATLPTPAPVSSISIDQTGVYMLAGCHDGSVRLWNLETRACLFDDTVAHHKKFDEGVLSVAIHPSRPLFASAGADGTIRVYRW